MASDQKNNSAAGLVMVLMLMVNAIILKNSYVDDSPDYRPLIISIPLLAFALVHCFGNKSS